MGDYQAWAPPASPAPSAPSALPASAARSGSPVSSAPLLQVHDLCVGVRRRGGVLPIVDHVTLSLGGEQTLAIVGESGSGKSLLAMSLVRLLEPAERYRLSGRVEFDGRDLLALPGAAMRAVRGRGIAMVFQDSLNALNPVLTIGRQIQEAVVQGGRAAAGEAARRETLRLLDEVKIPSPASRAGNYPHELSGGMRQRVMIAIALACRPRLIIADEPTTSLDLTIQSQILSLLRDVRRENGMSMIFISHNLGAVAAVADQIAVMYAGQIVETGAAEAILSRPRHPYTASLVAATPRVESAQPFAPIPGNVPPFDALPAACRYAPRCTRRSPRCDTEPPALAADGRPGAAVRCFHPVGELA